MPEESFQERTEPASIRKRTQARERGHVARSLELNSTIILFFATLLFFALGGTMLQEMLAAMRDGLANAGTMTLSREQLPALIMNITWRTGKIVLPLLITLVVVGIAANVLQVGFLLSGKPLLPKWDKISPAAGFKRLFSVTSFVELVKGLVKLAAVSLVAYLTLRQQWPHMHVLMEATAAQVLWSLGKLSMTILFRTTLVLLMLALLDYGFQRWRYEKSLRMTKEELREENRTTEGDPGIRARIRSVQREMARKRMMSKVPEADVVITNPVHLAVALKYDAATMRAPVVLAMGARLIAERIREIAREYDVPIVENPPLAQTLYKSATVGMEIPVEAYRAVAEVLGYIYRLRATSRA